jgi:hypothetical protein
MPTPVQPATSPLHSVGPAPDAGPAALWAEVLSTRDAVHRCRQLPADPAYAAARHDLLAALEAYVACLQRQHRPIPYALRDEVRLQRLTCFADRQVRYLPQGVRVGAR